MSDGGEDQGAEEALWGSRESVSSVLEAVSRVSERLSFQRRSLLSGSPPNGGHWGQRQSGQLGTSSPGTYSRRLPQRSCTPWTDCEVMMGGGVGALHRACRCGTTFPTNDSVPSFCTRSAPCCGATTRCADHPTRSNPTSYVWSFIQLRNPTQPCPELCALKPSATFFARCSLLRVVLHSA